MFGSTKQFPVSIVSRQDLTFGKCEGDKIRIIVFLVVVGIFDIVGRGRALKPLYNLPGIARPGVCSYLLSYIKVLVFKILA